MEKKRIKFYPLNDMAAGVYIEKSKAVLANLNDATTFEMNDVVELFLIGKYIKLDTNLSFPENSLSQINKIISQFLKNPKITNLSSLYNNVEHIYEVEFWDFFTVHNLQNRFNRNDFLEFLIHQKPNLRSILLNEKLVNHFDKSITEYIKSDFKNADILLDTYVMEHPFSDLCYHIPRSMTLQDKENLIIQYINSKNPSINYLRGITNVLDNNEFRLSPKTKLNAKQVLKLQEEKTFANATFYSNEIIIRYSKEQRDPSLLIFNNGNTDISYSFDWIENNLDFNTLFNNFIYLFEFIDDQSRITFTARESEIGAIEKTFTSRGKSDYPIGHEFSYNENITDLQLHSYLSLLKSFNIEIEDMIKWFFNDYVVKEFSIFNFNIAVPSKNTSYLEKIRILMPEIESILKKFKLLVEEGTIDLELLQMTSKPFSFSEYSSFLEKKYIYPNLEEINTASYLFFSDQCSLHYLEKSTTQEISFFKVLLKKNVRKSDYSDNLHHKIDWLIKNGYLTTDEDNYLRFKDLNLMWIIKELNFNEVINYAACPPEMKSFIDCLLSESFLKAENSFFSQPEQHYFNYYLNKSEYGNSLDLRNAYLHGTQPDAENNEGVHKQNYLKIIKLLILIIIKINDELCLKDSLQM